MDFVTVLVTDVLVRPEILVGIFALIGLLLQRKPFTEVFSGTVKTVVGLLIFLIGADTAVGTLEAFQALFIAGFNVDGVLPFAEGVVGIALEKYGSPIASVMMIGLITNIIFARLTPMKYVFLAGQHSLFFATMLTLALQASGVSAFTTIAVGGVVLGFFSTYFPWLARHAMQRITGHNDFGLAQFDALGYTLSSWIGKHVGNPEESTEKIKLPKSLSFFRDYVSAIAVTMIVFFYIAAFAAGPQVAREVAGDINWLLFPFLQALIFSAAVFILINGVEMLLGAIVPAFKGISDKLVPGVRPALDSPAVFPFAPTAVILGFLVSYFMGLVMMGVWIATGQTVIIPVALPYFFIGGTAGVFGNATGGWKGAAAGSAVIGVLISIAPQMLYPIMVENDLAGTALLDTDFAAVSWPLHKLFELGTTVGTAVTVLVLAAITAGVFLVKRREQRRTKAAV